MNLEPIKARLASADPKDWRTYNAQCQALFVTHQREDMFALVAEVERLRAAKEFSHD
jgi:ABC-type molybdenum transport system ATPase subunit/photorepair protein PhrA